MFTVNHPDVIQGSQYGPAYTVVRRNYVPIYGHIQQNDYESFHARPSSFPIQQRLLPLPPKDESDLDTDDSREYVSIDDEPCFEQLIPCISSSKSYPGK